MTMTQSRKTMPYVRLGNSGLKVSKIILGCMSYGDPKFESWMLPEEEGIKHIKAAYDMGIQTFDTADTYSNGVSEVILGKAIKKHQFPREEIVVMTKVFFVVSDNDMTVRFMDDGRDPKQHGFVNRQGLNRKHIFDSVKSSLKRLQLDYIDVLQCHRFDYDTPVEETMQALHDVVKAGYVRYIGMSSCYAWQFAVMQNCAINNHLTPFISMQNQYSLVYREEEREMMPTLKHFGVGMIPWSPLARGFVCRPLEEMKSTVRGEVDVFTHEYAKYDGNKEIVRRVEALAKKKNVSMAQIAAAWSMNKDGVTAPIVGTTSLKNLEDLVAAVHVELSPDEMRYLEEPYQPMAIFGFW